MNVWASAWASARIAVRALVAAAPTSRGGAQVVYGNLNWATSVQGVTPEFFTAREWDIADGRLFSGWRWAPVAATSCCNSWWKR
jgi:hypothetical protein